MSANEPSFRQIFASTIRPVISEEKDRLLAIASMQELSLFIPNIDDERNIDLLPIAFDACVVNRGNKNGDMMDTETALATYKTFVHKFIDTEHDRKRIIGVILTATLTEYGTNRPIREEDVRGKNIPFNITLGGVLWKAVNEGLCDLVEESGDSTSEKYMKVSASWELGFTGFRVSELPQNKKNLDEGVIIENPEFIAKVKKYLKCFGGCGVYQGKSYYRMPNENVVAMGVGLTEKPAADVQGIATKLDTEEDIPTAIAEEEAEASEKKVESNVEIISHSEEYNVKRERTPIMKITSIADITDDSLKQCTASVITQFIADELKKASDTFVAEKQEQATANEKLQETTKSLLDSVKEMKASLETLTNEKEARAKVDSFNSRMSEISASYELPNEVSKIVVEDLKALASDEAFASYKTKAETLFKPYSKASITEAKAAEEIKAKEAEEAKAAQAKADEEAEAAFKEAEDKKKADKGEDKKKDECKASVTDAVENALDNADKKDGGLPNSSSASSPGLKEKYATAFAEEGFAIKIN